MIERIAKRSTLLMVLAVAAAPALSVQETATEAKKQTETKLPPAEKIIAKHIEATGGKEARLKHKSSHVKGTISMPAMGISGPIEVFAARPNRLVSKIELTGMGVTREGFDGKVGWSIQPMVGPSVHEGLQLEQTRINSDYDSDLNKNRLYESVETVEVAEFEGRECFKIKLTPKAGPPVFEFYEVESGLRRGTTVTAVTPMGEIPVTNVESDYKEFDGLKMPAKMVQKAMMQEIIISIDSVEHDKVDESVFELPVEIKALASGEKPADKKPEAEKP